MYNSFSFFHESKITYLMFVDQMLFIHLNVFIEYQQGASHTKINKTFLYPYASGV